MATKSRKQDKARGDSTNQPDQLLQCGVCDCPYDSSLHEPKLLSCHHTSCLRCLKELSQGRKAFKCPVCSKKIPVPEDGVSDLPTNFYVSKVSELIAPNKSGTEVQTCQKHMNQPLLFFCETCGVPICMNCTVLDHEKSTGHVIKDIASVGKVHHNILKGKLGDLDSTLQTHQSNLANLKQELANLVNCNEVAMHQINETFSQLRAKIDKRQQELLGEVGTLYMERREEITKQAKQLKNGYQRLTSAKDRLQELLTEANPTTLAVTVNQSNTMSQLQEMCEPQPLKQIKGFLEFRYDKGLKAFVDSVQKLGEIKAEKSLPAVVKVDIGQAVSSVTSNIKLHITNSTGKALSHYPILSTITDPCQDELPTSIQCESHGVYLVNYQPQMPGKHILNVLFLNKPMVDMQKEFVVGHNNPVLVIGSEGNGTGHMFHPTSVAVAPNGNIYVADMGNKRIQIYDSQGEPLIQFKVGTSKSTTYDLAINPATDELLCTKVALDQPEGMVANSVRIFSLSAERKRQFIIREMENALFLTTNSKGWIIVTDSKANKVYILNKDGQVIKHFGTPGDKPGQFNFPSAICTGKKDEIIVSDTKNDRVQVFDKDGVFLHQFGQTGNVKTQIRAPRGVAADSNGNILVADMSNMIRVFKTNGTFVSCIDSVGDKINEPYNMTVTPDGYVFVADFKNSCIKKFKYL